MDFHRTTHAVYGLQYHIVLVTKYRKPCINDEIRERLKSEFHRLIEGREGSILSMEVMPDHVHILAELSPKYAISSEIAMLKGVTSRILRRDYGDYLKPFLWKGSFWSASYFIASCGGVTLDVLKQYVENQKSQTPKQR